eukprot:13992762-Ditylum_brightwellii.AAC.1
MIQVLKPDLPVDFCDFVCHPGNSQRDGMQSFPPPMLIMAIKEDSCQEFCNYVETRHENVRSSVHVMSISL